MKRLTICLLIFCALLLLACGEETVSEKILNNRISVVSSVAELSECGKSNDGEQVLVKEESSVRVCSDGKWFAVVGDTVYLQDESFACYAEKLLDGSGTKILCNGDSVGVVLNGENGANGEDGADGKMGLRGIRGEQGDDGKNGLQGPKGDSGAVGDVGENGIGCSIKKIDEVSVRVVCAADSTTLYIGDAPMELDSEKVAVSLDEVSGASQKGPYLSGSKVSAYEISDGRTLKQTGNVFNGKIANDKGEFRINSRSLVSQYLSLEATGYYRNEVTGKNSDAELTLRAITDVSERSVVNVNLLTHLEYERVNYLVTKEKMKVWAAKKQAQNEIFGMMFINAEDFDNSEDLNIAGSSDEDAALLAFSVLLQGDRSVSQLSELLTKIATDMEEDGIWNDYSTKDSIAEWALKADNSGLLDSIRKNVLDWGLSAMVPDFEKHVRHFWYEKSGLGECNGDRVGIIKWGYMYPWICKDINEPNEDYRWVVASYLERNIYQWEPGEDGEIRLGNISDASDNRYIYDAKLGQWRSTTAFEDSLGACIESVENDDSKNTRYFDCGASSVSQYKTERDCRYIDGYNLDGDWVYWERGWYRCIDRKWTQTTALYVDTRNWKPGEDADVVKGDRSEAFYVYDELELTWRKANEQDSTLGLNGCTTKRTSEVQKSAKDGEYYGCASDHRWILIPEKVVANTTGYECVEGAMQPGKDDSNIHFVCEMGLWREATIEEEQLGVVCTAANEGAFNKDSSKICKKYPWGRDEYRVRGVNLYDFEVYPDYFFNPELEYGELYDKRDGRTYRTIEINGITVMAENLNYADESKYRYLIDNNKCYDNDSINCLKGGRLYTWSAAMNVDPKWNFTSTGLADGLIESPHRGICPDGWHIPTVEEWAVLIDGYVVTVGYYYDLGGLYASGDFHIYDEVVATNASGLTILPSATRDAFDGYYGGYYPNFWSATTDRIVDPVSFVVANYTACNSDGSNSEEELCFNPVRCMKDSE